MANGNSALNLLPKQNLAERTTIRRLPLALLVFCEKSRLEIQRPSIQKGREARRMPYGPLR
jgi:hypothetical protein